MIRDLQRNHTMERSSICFIKRKKVEQLTRLWLIQLLTQYVVMHSATHHLHCAKCSNGILLISSILQICLNNCDFNKYFVY